MGWKGWVESPAGAEEAGGRLLILAADIAGGVKGAGGSARRIGHVREVIEGDLRGY